MILVALLDRPVLCFYAFAIEPGELNPTGCLSLLGMKRRALCCVASTVSSVYKMGAYEMKNDLKGPPKSYPCLKRLCRPRYARTAMTER